MPSFVPASLAVLLIVLVEFGSTQSAPMSPTQCTPHTAGINLWRSDSFCKNLSPTLSYLPSPNDDNTFLDAIKASNLSTSCKDALRKYSCSKAIQICTNTTIRTVPCAKECTDVTTSCPMADLFIFNIDCSIENVKLDACFSLNANDGTAQFTPKQTCFSRPIPQRLEPCSFTLLYSFWTSHQTTATLGTIILEEILGCSISWVVHTAKTRDENGGVFNYYRNLLTNISMGLIQVDLEQWASKNQGTLEMALKAGVLIDAGSIGYSGREGFYVSKNLGLVLYKYLRNESFTKQFNHTIMGASSLTDLLIRNLKFSLTQQYMDDLTMSRAIEDKLSRNEPVLFVFYEPHILAQSYTNQVYRMTLPIPNPTCLRLYVTDFNNYDCDFVSSELWKAFSPLVKTYPKDVRYFLDSIQMTTDDVANIVHNVTAVGSNLDGVCAWMKKEESKWRSWLLPTPPSPPAEDNVGLILSIVLPIGLGIVVIVLIALWWRYYTKHQKPYTPEVVCEVLKACVSDYAIDDRLQYLQEYNEEDEKGVFILIIRHIADAAKELICFVPQPGRKPQFSGGSIFDGVVMMIVSNALSEVCLELQLSLMPRAVWFLTNMDGSILTLWENLQAAVEGLGHLFFATAETRQADQVVGIGIQTGLVNTYGHVEVNYKSFHVKGKIVKEAHRMAVAACRMSKSGIVAVGTDKLEGITIPANITVKNVQLTHHNSMTGTLRSRAETIRSPQRPMESFGSSVSSPRNRAETFFSPSLRPGGPASEYAGSPTVSISFNSVKTGEVQSPRAQREGGVTAWRMVLKRD
eukprot:PhF_6_TR27146/c0_g1_i2/m.39648